MVNRVSRIVMPAYAPSYDGRYHLRYPHGDKPFEGAALEGSALAAASASGLIATQIRLAAQAGGVASASAGVSTGIRLAASAASLASATAQLAGTSENRSVSFPGNVSGGLGRIEIAAASATIPVNAVLTGDFTLSWRMRPFTGNSRPAISPGVNVDWVSSNILFDRDRFNKNRSWGIGLAGMQVCFGLWDSNNDRYTWVSPLVLEADATYWCVLQRARATGALQFWVNGIRQINAASGPTGDISCPSTGNTGKDGFLVIGAEKHDVADDYRGLGGEIHFLAGLLFSNATTITDPGNLGTVLPATRALYLLREPTGSTEIRDENGNQSPGVLTSGATRSTIDLTTYGDGDTLTLNGSFTSKSSPTPLVYDEFEDGTLGQPVNNRPATIGAWLSQTGSTPSSTPHVTYSNARAFKGTRSCRSDHTNAPNGNGSLYRDINGGSDTWYFDYWSYTQPVGGRSRNHKCWRLYGVGGNGLDNDIEMGNEVWRGAVRTGEHGPSPPWHYVNGIGSGQPGYQYDLPYNQWVHFEVELKATPSNSFYRNWHDSILICEQSKLASSVPGGARVGVRIQNYWALDAGDGYAANPGCLSFTDVAFVDRTLQRVVICNAPTFAAATRRAIQPSLSWVGGSSGQIRARVNTAGLNPSDEHYAMVLGPMGSTQAPELVQPVRLRF